MTTLSDLADSIAGSVGIPTNIFSSLIGQESGGGAGSPSTTWNPNAVGTSGEQGLGQLMPGIVAQYGVTNAFDPTQNLTASATYLKSLYDKFGNWADALSAYNSGSPTGSNNPAGSAYAASVLGGAGVTGTAAQGAGGATSGSPAGSNVMLYIGAIGLVIVLLFFGISATAKGA